MTGMQQLTQQVREQALAEGRAEGKADIVLWQPKLRFGIIPDAIEARVRSASSDDLEGFAQRVLTALTLEETVDPKHK